MAKTIFPSTAIMAPLAGVTDLPFRTIVREHGCSFAFTEMLAIKPLLSQSAKSWGYLKTAPLDAPLGAQIVGRDPHMMADAAAVLESMGTFPLIDINMGCPARKVVCKGEGSALLKEPKLIENIVTTIVKRVSLPITCKIRIGWTPETINAVEVAQRIEGAGAQAITVHGRTKDWGYAGDVDLSVIRAVKEAVTIPVIGNGNIFTPQDAVHMINETGCDHVMIARGALGNPWIFNAIENHDTHAHTTDLHAVEHTLLRHAQLMFDFYNEKKAVALLRKIGCWYFKWFPHKGQYRARINHITTRDDFMEAVKWYVSTAENEVG